MKPVDESGESSRHRFKIYCAYAWGCPLTISIVTVVMEYLPEAYANNIIQPGFGSTRCWFEGIAIFQEFVRFNETLNLGLFNNQIESLQNTESS